MLHACSIGCFHAGECSHLNILSTCSHHCHFMPRGMQGGKGVQLRAADGAATTQVPAGSKRKRLSVWSARNREDVDAGGADAMPQCIPASEAVTAI
jgi:hypothetical protein